MKITDKLFELFAGEFVNILLNRTRYESVQTDNNTIKNITMAIISSGYLVEEDDMYFYLGHEPTTISRAVKKDAILEIEIADPDQEHPEHDLSSLRTADDSELN